MLVLARFKGWRRVCLDVANTSVYNSFSAPGRGVPARCTVSTSASIWDIVVGLELHVQVNSRTKLFSAAPASAASPPNSNVSLFDASHPGTLPTLNWGCVEAAARTGLALGATVNPISRFDRKHYFYADLPHGFQITQQQHPIVSGGSLTFKVNGSKEPVTVDIQRIQLEMDTGKSLHDAHPQWSLIDLNRAGSGLMEVVTAPGMASGEEAACFVRTFQRLLRHLGTGTGNMEDGSLRVDVNVSVRRTSDGTQSYRCEIKNLNSTRSIQRAVDYEARRHRDIMEGGGQVQTETRTFDAARGCTVLLRGKETALDYRFMPEPDLPPLVIPDSVIAELARTTSELPEVASARLQQKHGLSPIQVDTLMGMPGAVGYLASVLEAAPECDPRGVVKLLLGDVVKELHARSLGFADAPSSASPARMAEILQLVRAGTLSGRMAKAVVAAVVHGDERLIPEIVQSECGGQQLTDEGELKEICSSVIAEYSQQVSDYRSGKTRLMGLFVGQVMKRTEGRGDPKRVTAILQALISE
mmetsp:Transcript_17437/g.33636  ORF Transcript_17437/g.33636 Transcript_17437/m.33636 type:complete len:528 (-) Transcript_17437:84-1667(-)